MWFDLLFSNPQKILLFIEAIAFSVIGAVAWSAITPDETLNEFIDHGLCAVVLGIILYSFLGEVTNVNVIVYIAGGFYAPALLRKFMEKYKKRTGQACDWISRA